MLIPIISSSSTINKPIDEKYIPDTIARTEDLLPTTMETHKQLVTDSDGNTVWADRLAYEGTKEVLTVAQSETFDGSGDGYYTNENGWYVSEDTSAQHCFSVDPGEYTVEFLYNEITFRGTANVKQNSSSMNEANTFSATLYDVNDASVSVHISCSCDQGFSYSSIYIEVDEFVGCEIVNAPATISLLKSSVETTIKTLDPKYIPDTIARSSQIVQADWNENDETSMAYVQNRTHYTEVVEKVVIDTANDIGVISRDLWPGYNGDLLESDYVSYADICEGSKISVRYGDEEYTGELKLLNCKNVYDNKVPQLMFGDFSIFKDNSITEPDLGCGFVVYCFYRPEQGRTYFNVAGAGPFPDVVKVAFDKVIISPLDPKFLAETAPTAHQQLVTDANGEAKWDDRLAYSVTNIVKGNRLDGIDGSESGTGFSGMSLDLGEGLEAGKTYWVYVFLPDLPDVNGPMVAQGNSGDVYLGNPALMEIEGESSDYLWCISQDGDLFFGKNFAWYTVAVYEAVTTETVQTIDPKFLPDTIARKTDIENHTQSASSITEGTFAGAVVAQTSSQTPTTSLLRNSKLVPEETDPVNNGEICWTYE